jgi:hypothetical protein
MDGNGENLNINKSYDFDNWKVVKQLRIIKF